MPRPICTLAFRGHQDQCFGVKLLFQQPWYEALLARDKVLVDSLHTGMNMYRDGPYWWRQVLELSQLPYTEVEPHVWSVPLTPQFMRRVLPLFTLTTAVAGRRLRFDSYCCLDVRRARVLIYERELLSQSNPRMHDFSAKHRRFTRQHAGFDPLHADADPVRRLHGGGPSFRVRTGDLVGRLGFLVSAQPLEWSPTPPTELTELDRELGLRHVVTDLPRLFPPSRTALHGGARLLRERALWAGGDPIRLTRLLHQLTTPGSRDVPKLWKRRRHQVLTRASHLPAGAFAQRLSVFARELLEYAGGDQMTSRKHMNGAIFDGGRPPSYATELLRDVREAALLYGLYCAQWGHVYRGTHDAHLRVMELPSRVMPEWRAPDYVLVLGDVHGSFHSLLRDLLHMRRAGFLTPDFLLRPDVMLVCLGDYVDYGPYGMEVLWTLLWLQLRNRKNVVLLGGNHEDLGQNEVVGGMPDNFALELDKRFGQAWNGMKVSLGQLYRAMPRALKCRVGDYELHFSHGCGTPAIHAMGTAEISSKLGEQIAWADVHQRRGQHASSRGGNVQVYGADVLQPLLGFAATNRAPSTRPN